MKTLYTIITFLCFLSTVSAQTNNYSFAVSGDATKYYPVKFHDANWSNNKETTIEIGRSSVHTDANWHGSLMSKFSYHVTRWGNGSHFINAQIQQNAGFIGGWRDATSNNADQYIIIWLRGGSTYYLNSLATITPVVYDGVQNPLPLQETNGPAHNFLAQPEPYVANYTGAFPSLINTRIRDDAGLQGNAGAVSGFFETYNPVNYPTGASSWWHLLDVRHSNTSNNYAMQFAGGFFDQELYFRKTNSSPATPWSRVLLANPDGRTLTVGRTTVDYVPSSTNWTTGSTLQLDALDFSALAFHDAGDRVDFIRSGKGTIHLGYNGGWGEANIGFPGSGIWNSTGNVGIGTTSPREKLSVNGKIRAHEIKVETIDWPDYVFEEGYKNLSLDELEKYIKTNKHLPEVPSAATVEKDGLALGEMNKILLKKVEELTLHLIEKDKQIKSMNDLTLTFRRENFVLSENLKVLMARVSALEEAKK